MALCDLSEDMVGGLEVSGYFLQKGWSKIWIAQQLHVLHWPMHKGFCDFDALEIGGEEWARPFHFFHDEEEGEDVEVFVVVLFALEDIIGFHDWPQLWPADHVDSDDDVLGHAHNDGVFGDVTVCSDAGVVIGLEAGLPNTLEAASVD